MSFLSSVCVHMYACACVCVEPAFGCLLSINSLAAPSHDMSHTHVFRHIQISLFIFTQIHALVILDSWEIMSSDTSFLVCKL